MANHLRLTATGLAMLAFAALLAGCGDSDDGDPIANASDCTELAEASSEPLRVALADIFDLANQYESVAAIPPDVDFDFRNNEDFAALGRRGGELECSGGFLDGRGCTVLADFDDERDTGLAEDLHGDLRDVWDC